MAFRAITFSSTNKVLIDYAQLVVELQKNYLIETHKMASGELVNSISYEIIDTENGKQVNVLAIPYWKFVEEGRDKNDRFPPPQPIAKWLKEKRIRPERGISFDSLVFLVSRAIARDGIRPVPFVEASQKTLERKFDQDKSLLEAFEQDVLTTIPSIINP